MRRVSRLEEEAAALRSRSESQERRIAELTRRIWGLERGGVPPVEPATTPPAEVAPPEPTAQATAPAPAPEPVRVREDWETRLGANWLNRAGALILVVGIALFLGYSLTQLGPAGKVAIGFLAGLSLLGGGVVLDRHPVYRNFSFSLVGAGWAVVYSTTYALHGLPASRLVEDPVVGAALLLGVSAAMIAHALRYRSETATGLAYLFGFVSLNVSPLTSFSVVASLLLAVSLIFLAYRMEWCRLPLAGVLFTYLTFLLRYDPSIWGRGGVWNAQATLWIYWLAFEAFDLADLRRRGAGLGVERSLLPLNAIGFVGASLLHEWRMTSQDWPVFLFASALAYLASAGLRARWARREGGAEPSLLTGGYEASAAVSSALMAGALIERFDGLDQTLALLIEGEMVFLAGLALGSASLRRVGGALLALPLLRLLAVDAHESGEIAVGVLRLERWTPLAVGMAVTFAANRRLAPAGWLFAVASGVLVFAIALAELPGEWVAPVGAMLAVAAFLAGSRWAQSDLRWLSFPAGLFAAGAALGKNVSDGAVVAGGCAIALLYVLHRLWRASETRVSTVLSMAATAVLTAFVFEQVQGRLLTVACGLEGASLLVAGFVLKDRAFRLWGLALFFFCIGKLFVYDLRELDTVSRILSFIVLGVVLLGASWVYARFRDKLSRLL